MSPPTQTAFGVSSSGPDETAAPSFSRAAEGPTRNEDTPDLEIGWWWEDEGLSWEDEASVQETRVSEILDGRDIPPDGVLVPPSEAGESTAYVTGTGGVIGDPHSIDQCTGRHCVIHDPSDHTMRDFPTHFRFDRYLMERICPHGVGHPDPDDLAWQEANLPERAPSVHGCDGCCAGAYDHIPVTVPPKYDPSPQERYATETNLQRLIDSARAAAAALSASVIRRSRGIRA